mmetsp:Transcript_68243/g.120734  ORF Transcript_68243/g.120734 Transcript_68243/m.120734 type:complete len:216 (+) Transcript_68243:1438-2085(+)
MLGNALGALDSSAFCSAAVVARLRLWRCAWFRHAAYCVHCTGEGAEAAAVSDYNAVALGSGRREMYSVRQGTTVLPVGWDHEWAGYRFRLGGVGQMARAMVTTHPGGCYHPQCWRLGAGPVGCQTGHPRLGPSPQWGDQYHGAQAVQAESALVGPGEEMAALAAPGRGAATRTGVGSALERSSACLAPASGMTEDWMQTLRGPALGGPTRPPWPA